MSAAMEILVVIHLLYLLSFSSAQQVGYAAFHVPILLRPNDRPGPSSPQSTSTEPRSHRPRNPAPIWVKRITAVRPVRLAPGTMEARSHAALRGAIARGQPTARAPTTKARVLGLDSITLLPHRHGTHSNRRRQSIKARAKTAIARRRRIMGTSCR